MILCMQEDVNSIMLYNNLTAMGIVSGIPFLAILRIFQSIVQSANAALLPDPARYTRYDPVHWIQNI